MIGQPGKVLKEINGGIGMLEGQKQVCNIQCSTLVHPYFILRVLSLSDLVEPGQLTMGACMAL